MLYTLFQRLHSSALTSLSSANAKSSDKRKSYPLGSYEPSAGGGGGGKKQKKYRHPLSMPNDTAMDSDERIVVEGKEEGGFGGVGVGRYGEGRFGGGMGGLGRDRGIRVQTDLHVESSEGGGETVGMGMPGTPGRGRGGERREWG